MMAHGANPDLKMEQYVRGGHAWKGVSAVQVAVKQGHEQVSAVGRAAYSYSTCSCARACACARMRACALLYVRYGFQRIPAATGVTVLRRSVRGAWCVGQVLRAMIEGNANDKTQRMRVESAKRAARGSPHMLRIAQCADVPSRALLRARQCLLWALSLTSAYATSFRLTPELFHEVVDHLTGNISTSEKPRPAASEQRLPGRPAGFGRLASVSVALRAHCNVRT